MPLKNIDTITEETQHKIIAVQLVAGTPKTKIQSMLGLSSRALDKVLHSEDFRVFFQDYSTSLVNSAANTWKAAMSDRIVAALKVLDKHLRDNNLEAVKLVMKGVGLDKVQPETQTNAAITVVLPGQEPVGVKNDIEVSEGEYSPVKSELPSEGV